jgi:hypothetical protein
MPYERVTVYTLVDITSSGAVHVRDSHTKEYHQMQNLNVLIQTIGLRAQPINYRVVKLEDQDLSEYEFGDAYTGNQSVWRLTFEHEHPLAWYNNDHPFGQLIEDATGIAITTDLDNTVDFDINIFDCKTTPNLYFEEY